MAEKRSKAVERVRTVGFMLAVTLVSISILSSLYVATAERVARNELLFTRRAVIESAGLAVPATVDETLALFDRCVSAVPAETNAAYYVVRTPDGVATQACVFPAAGAGLWGQIDALVGLDAALKTVTGITFIRQAETPGLGARIEEPWFKLQFAGKTGPFAHDPEGTKSTAPDRFDGITGATITTLAVRDILNTTLSRAPERKAAAPR
jgi:Na+-transporting NADH:ubiquinone oxidoreductase subunit C